MPFFDRELEGHTDLSTMRIIDLMLAWLAKPGTRCWRCAKRFPAMTPCVNGEVGPFFSRLWDARYTCASCGISFHGACAAGGRSGEKPGSVRVTCPKCGLERNYQFPFEILPYGPVTWADASR